jgi:alkanesulfonate monooxygenase SsuD/methylene tetrahydromethanopterin reductase-like flavin-dependent oxidoreductase (luciferase family)
MLNQVRHGILAEELGYAAWALTEHHFSVEGAEFSPNPLIVQTAVAAETSRIRLMQIANIITQHNPVRLAEQLAMLDVLSGGRVEAGFGRGYQPREVEVFGWGTGATVQDDERNRRFYEEAYEVILKAWTESSFGHHGEYFSVPPSHTRWNHKQTIAYFSEPGADRPLDGVLKIGGPAPGGVPVLASSTTLREITVFPQPVQKPYPQIWQPVSSPRSLRHAAAMGANAAIEVPNVTARQMIEIYYEEAERLGWPDRCSNGQFKFGWDGERRRGIMVNRMIHISDRGIGDMERAARGVEMQWDYYGPFGFTAGLTRPGEQPLAHDTKVTQDLLIERNVAIHGTKEFVTQELLRCKEEAGYGEDFGVMLWFELAGFSGAEIEDQMICFAEEIMPVLERECGGRAPITDCPVDLRPQRRPVTV